MLRRFIMGLRRTNTRGAVALFLLLAALAATVAACGGKDGDSDAGASSVPDLSAEQQAEFETALEFARCMREHGIEGLPDPQVSGDGFMFVGVPLAPRPSGDWNEAQEACQPVFGDAASPDGTAAPAGWERIVPGGDCQCSDGSEFSFWVREANPEKVVFFLEAGGGCFSAETCAPGRDLYSRHSEGPGEGGMFDFADERNPFADYSVVYVPYCTGDVHIGDVTTEYAPGLTVHHKGYANGTAALDHLAAAYPGATDVVVMGESAGSIAAPLYAGLVSDRLPDARITVLADGSGSYPDVRPFNEVFATWGFGNVVPPWPENAGLTAEEWSAPGLFIQSGRHDREIVFARHDYAYDEKQAFWYPLLDTPADDLLSLIDANETQIEAAGVNLLSYIAPGDDHTALSDGTFYTEEVNGQPLVDWVTRLIEGDPIDDVHCRECRG
jgi:Pectinacetylesterase